MKAYSLDLRQKIIEVYENEEISIASTSEKVSCSPQLYCQVTEAVSRDRRNSAKAFWWRSQTQISYRAVGNFGGFD